MIDHDGVASMDPPIRSVVEYPDGSVHGMPFIRPARPTAGYYELYDSNMPQSGNYTFRVTDPDGNESEAVVEFVDVNPLPIPDEDSLRPA